MSSIIRRRGTVAAAILTGLIAIATVARDSTRSSKPSATTRTTASRRR